MRFKATVLAVFVLLVGTFVWATPAAAEEPNPCGDPLLEQVGPDGSCVQSTAQDPVRSAPAQDNIRDSGIPIIGEDPPNADSAAISLFNRLLNGFVMIITAIAVIVIIISGLRYVVSGGDPQTVQTSRNAIIYALVALIIVIVARSIVSFILTKV